MRPIILRQLKYIIRPAANYRTLTRQFTLCVLSDYGIERLFEATLDMAHNDIEALLESLDPITKGALIERIIGNACDDPMECLL